MIDLTKNTYDLDGGCYDKDDILPYIEGSGFFTSYEEYANIKE